MRAPVASKERTDQDGEGYCQEGMRPTAAGCRLHDAHFDRVVIEVLAAIEANHVGGAWWRFSGARDRSYRTSETGVAAAKDQVEQTVHHGIQKTLARLRPGCGLRQSGVDQFM